MNGLLNLIANIIVFGLFLWVVNAFIPLPSPIKSILNVLVIIVLILYILQFFGVIGPMVPMFRIIR